MDALEALIGRTSCPRLEGPAPTAEQVDLMLRAALRAPDHGALRPWRFILTEGEGLERLGELFLRAARETEPELTPAMEEKYRQMPLRAPMIITVVAVLQEHPKVPEEEQLISAGCAAHAITQAAHALDLGAIWRTGAMTHNPRVRSELGLTEQEQIVGFIYLGQRCRERKTPVLDPQTFLTRWEG